MLAPASPVSLFGLKHDQTFKKYMQILCNFYMSNLFYSAFRPRFDVNLTLHALRRDLEIWSGGNPKSTTVESTNRSINEFYAVQKRQ